MAEGCVEERGEERYCWRAGVMSRNERGEGEGLLVWRVFFSLKARSLSRETLVREGMSVGENRVIGNTLQSDMGIVECVTVFSFSSECIEFRQVYSSIHFIITTSHYQFTGVINLELECTPTKSNGGQFRQVYSSFPFQAIHSQTLHENNSGMHNNQTGVISNWASLFIISFFQNHSSIPMKHNRNSN